MSNDNSRRKFLQTTSAAAGVIAAPMLWHSSAHAQWNNQPEKGAKLRVLRWKRFVQGDEDQYIKNVKAFSDKYKIDVKLDQEGWEDVRPKAAVAANTGAGPDIILSTNDDANLYPDKLVDMTDVCDYLGKKYGGWYPACESFLRPDGKKWIGVPLGGTGSMMVYRDSQLKAAGINAFPKDTDGFLKMFQALKAKGTPGGMALGHATGDSGWTQWLMWAFGGTLVDKNNKVIINSPETIKALEYSKELYATFVPGTLSWLDPNNNKAFLDGQVSRHEQRHLDLLRRQELARSQAAGDGQGHPARDVPDRSGRRAHGIPPLLQPDGLQAHQVPEGGQGVRSLHDGAGAVRPLDAGRRRLHLAAAAGLRERTRSGPPIPRTRRTATRSRTCVRPAMRASWATRRRARWPTSSCRTWWPRPPAARRRPKEAAERAQQRAERYYKV